MAVLTPNAKQQFFDNAGNPAAGYKLYTYATGTATPQATYSNLAGSAANANPIILDARGEATIYLTAGEVYDYVLKTPLDAEVWTRAGVEGGGGGTDTTIRPDLASTAAGKGAELVGTTHGSTVDRALILGQRRPRKVFSKLFASAAAATHLRIVMLGDSLAMGKMQQVLAALDRRMGGGNGAGTNTAGTISGSGPPAGGVDCDRSAPSGVTDETGQYQYWPTGAVQRFDAGGTAAYIFGGAAPTFTSIKVYYVTEPGAGTINLVVGGATVATASANAAAGLGVLSYTQAKAQATVAVNATGAAVRVLFVHVKRSDLSGVDRYIGMNLGGLLLANAASSAQGLAIWQAALADIAPDLVTFEMDDDFGDGAANDAAWGSLVGILDVACPLADKLIIGSTPRAASDALKLRSSNYLRHYCGGKNASWLFFDSYYLMGSYADMDAIFGASDGTHPVAAAQGYAAAVMLEFLALDAASLGYQPMPVNAAGVASRLWRGSSFMGDGNDRKLDLSLESANGFDWEIRYPRNLFFAGRGDFGSSSTVTWQFSANTAVFPHVVPISFDFTSAGNVRKLDTNTSTGIEYTRFRKTDNPGGGFMHLRTGLLWSTFTRAELLAIAANSNVGAMAFCTDCTGGAQWVYAKGTFPTDWVTVDGKAAI